MVCVLKCSSSLIALSIPPPSSPILLSPIPTPAHTRSVCVSRSIAPLVRAERRKRKDLITARTERQLLQKRQDTRRRKDAKQYRKKQAAQLKRGMWRRKTGVSVELPDAKGLPTSHAGTLLAVAARDSPSISKKKATSSVAAAYKVTSPPRMIFVSSPGSHVDGASFGSAFQTLGSVTEEGKEKEEEEEEDDDDDDTGDDVDQNGRAFGSRITARVSAYEMDDPSEHVARVLAGKIDLVCSIVLPLW